MYAYDQRGFGANDDAGRWPGVPMLVDDLVRERERLATLHPDVPVYLLGESMGAAVIIAAAADGRPARRRRDHPRGARGLGRRPAERLLSRHALGHGEHRAGHEADRRGPEGHGVGQHRDAAGTRRRSAVHQGDPRRCDRRPGRADGHRGGFRDRARRPASGAGRRARRDRAARRPRRHARAPAGPSTAPRSSIPTATTCCCAICSAQVVWDDVLAWIDRQAIPTESATACRGALSPAFAGLG